jgi:hypothetical protein
MMGQFALKKTLSPYQRFLLSFGKALIQSCITRTFAADVLLLEQMNLFTCSACLVVSRFFSV